MRAAGLDLPPLTITADDVQPGKPAPDCCMMAARAPGVAPARCIVIEDADAGIVAGLATCMRVLTIGPADVRVVHDAEGLGLLVGETSPAACKTRTDVMSG